MKLSSLEIRIKLLRKGVTSAELARKWDEDPENISRVINRTPGFVFPDIRQKLADFLEVDVSAVGREPKRITSKAA